MCSSQGSASVQVEQRRTSNDSFGRGIKVCMSFDELVWRVAGGDDSVYLTTQPVAVAPDGHPELCAAPVAQLQGDFPLRPALLGNLVPQQLNLWMGAAPAGEHAS